MKGDLRYNCGEKVDLCMDKPVFLKQKITNGKTEFIIFQCIWYHFYKDFLETYIFIRQQVVKDVE